jgi:hypothetical protein
LEVEQFRRVKILAKTGDNEDRERIAAGYKLVTEVHTKRYSINQHIKIT